MGNHSFQHSLIEKRSSFLSPSNYLHTTVANTMREGSSFQTATMFTAIKFERLRRTGSAHRGFSLNRQARSETKPTTSPLNFVHFLAQHVQCHMAAQGYLCHLPVLQEARDFVTRSMQSNDIQRLVDHVVCLIILRRLTSALGLVVWASEFGSFHCDEDRANKNYQLADILTMGMFTKMQWRALLNVWQIRRPYESSDVRSFSRKTFSCSALGKAQNIISDDDTSRMC